MSALRLAGRRALWIAPLAVAGAALAFMGGCYCEPPHHGVVYADPHAPVVYAPRPHVGVYVVPPPVGVYFGGHGGGHGGGHH